MSVITNRERVFIPVRPNDADVWTYDGAKRDAKWLPLPVTASYILKKVDEVRIANTTLTDDSNLQIVLSETGWYKVRFVVLLSAANPLMNYKYATAFSGTATARYFRRHIPTGASSGTDNEYSFVSAGQVNSTSVTGGTTGVARVEIEIIMNVSAAGTLRFQWAQNTSDGAPLICLAESYAEWIKL